MSVFLTIGIMLNSTSLFQKDRRQLKALNPPKLNNNILGVIKQSCNKNTEFLWVCANFPKIILIFANFTIGMIGNETGRLLKCVKLYGKCIDMHET